LRRRMAERRHRRANVGEAEREGEGKRSWRAPSPRREASGRRKCQREVVERRRGLELQAPTMAAARKLGFCEGGSDGCGFRVPGGRGVALIGRGRGLSVRAKGRRGARGRVRLGRESGSSANSGTSPTGGGHLAVRQGGEGGAGPDWARRRGTGRRWKRWARKKKEGERGPAGLKG